MACLGLKATTQTFHSRSSSATNRVKVRIASLLTTYAAAPWFVTFLVLGLRALLAGRRPQTGYRAEVR